MRYCSFSALLLLVLLALLTSVSTTNAEKRNDSSSLSNRLAVGGSIRATLNRERILPKDEEIAVATTPAPTIISSCQGLKGNEYELCMEMEDLLTTATTSGTTTTVQPTTTAPTISSLPSVTPSYWPTYLTYLPTVSDGMTVGVTVSLPTEIGMGSDGVTPTPTTTSDAATTADEITEIENEITVIENEIANIESNEEKNAAAAITISDVVGETTQSSSESIKFDQESILIDGKFRC
jgi:hypothetical protein